MATPPSKGKLLYHITHIDNIPSILTLGLMSRKTLEQTGIYFKDTADQEILNKRENYKDSLSQYVLFHFFAKNPYDGAVCKTNGAENMVIITIPRALHQQYRFLVIPSHPLDSDTPDIYPYEEGLKKIRWDILDMQVGRDYHNPEIKKACMAECVADRTISPLDFYGLYVKTEAAKAKIQRMENSHLVNIEVKPFMFP